MRYRKQRGCLEEYAKMMADGRGCGRFNKYKPALTIYDVPSIANKFRVPLLRFDRTFHCLSAGECRALMQFEWNDDIQEIREQYPLDPNVTLKLCREYGIRHPGATLAHDGIVMTTDFLLTKSKGGGRFEFIAVQIKYDQNDVDSKRTQEKLFIEREYWQRQGIAWKLILSSNFNAVLCNNLDQLCQMRNTSVSPGLLRTAAQILQPMLKEPELRFASMGVQTLLKDPVLGALTGCDLVKLLIAHKVWEYSGLRTKCFIDSVMGDFVPRR